MCNKAAYYKKWKQHQRSMGHCGPRGHRRWHRGMHLGVAGDYPPVNIKELDDRYELYVYAPGLTKSDFQISVADRILTIRVESPENSASGHERWRRQEFKNRGFRREFELNDKIDGEAISASYENGVLLLTLPKREGFETVRQEIDIV